MCSETRDRGRAESTLIEVQRLRYETTRAPGRYIYSRWLNRPGLTKLGRGQAKIFRRALFVRQTCPFVAPPLS